MLLLQVIFALFTSVKTEQLLGVNYSFDVDFDRNFDSKKCDSENMWLLMKYEGLDVDPPFRNSGRAIQALGESCSSSFPIIFVYGILEINVYALVISDYFKLSIEVFDEDGLRVTRYVYRRSSKGFESGWRRISLKINKHIRGYIQLRGRSLGNEILLIDSFRYTPNTTTNFGYRRAKRSVSAIHENEDEAEIIFDYKLNKYLNNIESLESSGDGDDNTEPPNGEDPEEERAFWNPLAITLVAFGGFVVLVLTMVGAYYCGKSSGWKNDPLVVDDVEPPRTITIPRVPGTSNRGPSRLYEF